MISHTTGVPMGQNAAPITTHLDPRAAAMQTSLLIISTSKQNSGVAAERGKHAKFK